MVDKPQGLDDSILPREREWFSFSVSELNVEQFLLTSLNPKNKISRKKPVESGRTTVTSSTDTTVVTWMSDRWWHDIMGVSVSRRSR